MTHDGFTVWFTGLSGAGKSTLSARLMTRLRERGAKAELLDGDAVRATLSRDLGFSPQDRDVNVRRIGFICELLARNGIIAIVAAMSPFRDTREEVKRRLADFVEIFVDCPLEILIARDAKGLYRRAVAGEIDNFPGISERYEAPLEPDVIVHSDRESVDESVGKVWMELERRGLIREL